MKTKSIIIRVQIECIAVKDIRIVKNGKRNIHKGISGVQRKSKEEQGFFDGRFVSRSQPSKKVYKRKLKHKSAKNQNYES